MSPSVLALHLQLGANECERERADAAVQSLYLQFYTADEIANAVGMPSSTVEALFPRIRNYEIVGIPGDFTEDPPDESAALERAIDPRDARPASL